MIDRKKYIEMCQRNSVSPKSEVVLYNGARYYPVFYKMWFDDRGQIKNVAHLMDEKANSRIEVLLSDIEECHDKDASF